MANKDRRPHREKITQIISFLFKETLIHGKYEPLFPWGEGIIHGKGKKLLNNLDESLRYKIPNYSKFKTVDEISDATKIKSIHKLINQDEYFDLFESSSTRIKRLKKTKLTYGLSPKGLLFWNDNILPGLQKRKTISKDKFFKQFGSDLWENKTVHLDFPTIDKYDLPITENDAVSVSMVYSVKETAKKKDVLNYPSYLEVLEKKIRNKKS